MGQFSRVLSLASIYIEGYSVAAAVSAHMPAWGQSQHNRLFAHVDYFWIADIHPGNGPGEALGLLHLQLRQLQLRRLAIDDRNVRKCFGSAKKVCR